MEVHDLYQISHCEQDNEISALVWNKPQHKFFQTEYVNEKAARSTVNKTCVHFLGFFFFAIFVPIIFA